MWDTEDPDLATCATRLARLHTACHQALVARERANQAAPRPRDNRCHGPRCWPSRLTDAAAVRGGGALAQVTRTLPRMSASTKLPAGRSEGVRRPRHLALTRRQAHALDLDSARLVAEGRRRAAAGAGTEATASDTWATDWPACTNQLADRAVSGCPARADLAMVTGLAAFRPEGRSRTTASTRLSAYVLAHRWAEAAGTWPTKPGWPP